MDPGSSAPLGIALLGLLLGMRHATDPDHVIAVTAILSRERRISVATRIGVIWGLGHTLTVLAVGTAIIASKLAVPTRLGLAMEFAVAVVLILLGVEAFAALVRRIASRLFGSPLPDAKTSCRPFASSYSRRRSASPSALSSASWRIRWRDCWRGRRAPS
jgi:hypothetical protein